MLAIFDAWLLRLMLASLISTAGLLIWWLLRRRKPRFFSVSFRVSLLAALMLLSLVAWPITRPVRVPEPAHSHGQLLRLENQLQPERMDVQAATKIIQDHVQSSNDMDLQDEDLMTAMDSRTIVASLEGYARPETTLMRIQRALGNVWPVWRMLYVTGLLAMLGVSFYRVQKTSKRQKHKEKSFDGMVLSDPESVQHEHEMDTEGKLHQGDIDEWRRCLSAWRDALGFYRRGTLVFTNEDPCSLKNTFKARFLHLILLPLRPVTTEDWPQHWQGRKEVSAEAAHALYRLRHGKTFVLLLAKIVTFMHWYHPLWHRARQALVTDLDLLRQQFILRRLKSTEKHRKASRFQRLPPRLAAWSMVFLAFSFVFFQQPRAWMPDLGWAHHEAMEDHGIAVAARSAEEDRWHEEGIYSQHRQFRPHSSSNQIFLSHEPFVVEQTTMYMDENQRIEREAQDEIFLTMLDENDQALFHFDLGSLLEAFVQQEQVNTDQYSMQLRQRGHVFIDAQHLVVLMGILHWQDDADQIMEKLVHLKLDVREGSVLEKNFFPKSILPAGDDIIMLQDGSVLMVNRNETHEERYEGLVNHRFFGSMQRVDASGQTIWQQEMPIPFGGANWPGLSFIRPILSIQRTSDGGFFLISSETWYDRSEELSQWPYRPERIMLYRFNADGHLLQETKLEGDMLMLYGSSLARVTHANDEIYLCGQKHSQGYEKFESWMFKESETRPDSLDMSLEQSLQHSEAYINSHIMALDSEGNLMWQQTLPFRGLTNVRQMIIDDDDLFVTLSYQTDSSNEEKLYRIDRQDGSIKGVLTLGQHASQDGPFLWNGDHLIVDESIYHRLRGFPNPIEDDS